MNKMEIFRIETVADGDGMWYTADGLYRPRILRVENAKAKDLPMGFDPVKYQPDGKSLSCGVSDLTMLELWFTQEDRFALYDMGYGIFRFESNDFVVEPTQILFRKDLTNRKLIDYF